MNELPESNGIGGPPDLEALDYLREVKSSTCLLLPTTPSPTPLDFKHPLSEEAAETPFLSLNDMPIMENPDTSAGDSSSSGDSNSVVQDPVSAQLINNFSMLDYQTLSKNGDVIMRQVDDCKLNGSITINKKLPGFVNWDWSLIRKVLLWIVLSGLIACIGSIIAMVINIPKSCNPDLPWYQGKVFYEIFPPAFHDSNHDGTGDLRGIIKNLDYIHGLGASAIRLNSIFKATHYPEQYYNVTSLMEMDPSIGTIKDFENLVDAVHNKNMYLILDLPVVSMATPMTKASATYAVGSNNKTALVYLDETSEAIAKWAQNMAVDGFYLKKLENFVHDANFGRSLQVWKNMIGSGKIFIASEKTLKAQGDALNVLLSRVDLIDVHIDLKGGVKKLKSNIEMVVNGILWSKPHYPWVHWNIGNIDSERVASKHVNNTLVLTALEFVLPGTVSIFYGDEIGLGDMAKQESSKDIRDHEYIPNLVQMTFANNVKNDFLILQWNPKSSLDPKYHFLETIRSLTEFRLNTPTIYLRAIYKDGNMQKNIGFRDNDLVVIERWYPRRNTCVFVGNLGNSTITVDLTAMFYGGTVIVGTNSSLIGQVLYFDQVTFPPNSAIVVKLEK